MLSVVGLQGELESAQARLQQLQEDLGELRRALQDTQSQLKDVKAENAILKTGSLRPFVFRASGL